VTRDEADRLAGMLAAAHITPRISESGPVNEYRKALNSLISRLQGSLDPGPTFEEFDGLVADIMHALAGVALDPEVLGQLTGAAHYRLLRATERAEILLPRADAEDEE